LLKGVVPLVGSGENIFSSPSASSFFFPILLTYKTSSDIILFRGHRLVGRFVWGAISRLAYHYCLGKVDTLLKASARRAHNLKRFGR